MCASSSPIALLLLNILWDSCAETYSKLTSTSQDEQAIKAKLRRLCELKKGGKLQVPQWLHDEWKAGDHLAMARELEACGFDKASTS